MIGGFIVGPTTKVGVRGIGPSLRQSGVNNPLQNPSLDLRDADGTQVALNDDWKIRSKQKFRRPDARRRMNASPR